VPNILGNQCMQGLKDFPLARSWLYSRATKRRCRGCYCGRVQAVEVQEEEEVRLCLDRKIQVLEMESMDCLMIPKDPNKTCDEAQCLNDGVECLPVDNGRCYPHFRTTGIKTSWIASEIPATCHGCRCMQKSSMRGTRLLRDFAASEG
jgi:hypothetical protein